MGQSDCPGCPEQGAFHSTEAPDS